MMDMVDQLRQLVYEKTGEGPRDDNQKLSQTVYKMVSLTPTDTGRRAPVDNPTSESGYKRSAKLPDKDQNRTKVISPVEIIPLEKHDGF